MRFEVVEVPIPEPTAVEAPDADRFRAVARLQRDVFLEGLGPDARLQSDRSLAAHARNTNGNLWFCLAAVADGAVIGSAFGNSHFDGSPKFAWVEVGVDAGWRRGGIGRALWHAAVARTKADGAQTCLTDVACPLPAPGRPVLVPDDGFGEAPADSPGVMFAQAMGLKFDWLELTSGLALPVPADVLAGAEASAQERSAGYEVVTWFGHLPDQWAADFAALEARLGADAPSGNVEFEVAPYTPDHVRAWEAEAIEGRDPVLGAGAIEQATGRMVAATWLNLPLDLPDGLPVAAHQNTTLVLPEHRGHRLGLAVKVAALRRLAALGQAQVADVVGQPLVPRFSRVVTQNAAANDSMWSINQRLGFQRGGLDLVWSLPLA
ncbi:MAG: GNAT family N-acetyltransferase [Bifidobacteriaceae bacterium]|jgi:GNAT superfamily N-acetyltransferase|nr:GNAT family N-acetyltransferase [Bifidobacteriaceae bacterium]